MKQKISYNKETDNSCSSSTITQRERQTYTQRQRQTQRQTQKETENFSLTWDLDISELRATKKS